MLGLVLFSFVFLVSCSDIGLDSDGALESGSDDYSNETVSYSYNGFDFILDDGLWWTAVYFEDRNTILQVPLHYGARDLVDVKFSGTLDLEFDDYTDVYISIDPLVRNKYYTLALSEVNFNLVKGVLRRPVGVCSSEDEACVGREIVSCADNALGVPVIEFVLEAGSSGRVEFDGMCVRVVGDGETLLHAADALILLWYGVI